MNLYSFLQISKIQKKKIQRHVLDNFQLGDGEYYLGSKDKGWECVF